jgi:hypothetical protein
MVAVNIEGTDESDSDDDSADRWYLIDENKALPVAW